MAQVVVENVYKSYRKGGKGDRSQADVADRETVKQMSVLRDINFTVEDGEFLVLVGPSGCGKSTLLRLLAGLEELTGGNISIGDRTVNHLPPKARDIAMVFQNYALYPHLNIYDNLAFGLRRTKTGRLGDWETGRGGVLKDICEAVSPCGTPSDNWERSKRIKGGLLDDVLTATTRYFPRSLKYLSAKEKTVRDRVRYVASLLQIEPLLNRLPKELSGGQKQRVALGRAIARNPQVFLMDEPLSNLDAKLRTQTRAQIVQLQRKLRTTTIYVTHDQTEAMTMGDRIAVMNDGQIQQIAPPLEIYERPANRFVAEFIGSPPMNFLSVDLASPQQLVGRNFSLNLSLDGRRSLQNIPARSLVLGIRPQHLSISTASESNLQIEVDLVEALGNETYVFAHLVGQPDATLTVSLPPDKPVGVGDRLWLAIDLNKIHLFTVDDGQAIAV